MPVFSIFAFLDISFGRDFLSSIYPDGIHFRMTEAQVRAARDQLTEMPSTPASRNASVLAERLSSTTSAWYYFREGKLVGFRRLTVGNQLTDAQRTEEEGRIIPRASDGFTKDDELEALRTGATLDARAIKVVRWKSNSDSLQLFTVNAVDELSVAIFQPKYLSWDDFFVGLEMKGELEIEKKRISKILDEAQAKNGLATLSRTSSQAMLPLPTPAPSALPSSTPKVAIVKYPSALPIVPMAILAAVVVGIIALFRRRK